MCVICLYPDNEQKCGNVNTAVDGHDKHNSVSLWTFGLVVGLLCAVIATLLCVIIIILIRSDLMHSYQ